MDSVLLIDRDATFLENTSSQWNSKFAVLIAENEDNALAILKKNRVSVVVAEFGLIERSGFLEKMKIETNPSVPVMVLCTDMNIDRVPAMIHNGVVDFTFRDLSPSLLKEKIERVIRQRELERQIQALQNRTGDQGTFVFASDAMKKVHFEVTRLASRDFDILLVGETGAGKDLIAAELHRRSSRSHKPFVALPVRSLSETLIESEIFGHEKGAFSGADTMKVGKLEAANDGTLYIPEVTSLTEATQLKLLHFLQYRTITRVGQDARKPEIQLNVRIIFATNEKVEDEVANGKLRADFYYRISGVKIHIPPLRERPDDIEPLLEYFIAKHTSPADLASCVIAPGVVEEMKRRRLHGNVRELENCVKEMIAASNDGVLKLPESSKDARRESQSQRCEICLEDNFAELPAYAEAELQFKSAYFTNLLRRTGNNITRAASKAGMTPQGLRKLIHALNLHHE